MPSTRCGFCPLPQPSPLCPSSRLAHLSVPAGLPGVRRPATVRRPGRHLGLHANAKITFERQTDKLRDGHGHSAAPGGGGAGESPDKLSRRCGEPSGGGARTHGFQGARFHFRAQRKGRVELAADRLLAEIERFNCLLRKLRARSPSWVRASAVSSSCQRSSMRCSRQC